jgi:hypothetical protein
MEHLRSVLFPSANRIELVCKCESKRAQSYESATWDYRSQVASELEYHSLALSFLRPGPLLISESGSSLTPSLV